MRGDVQVPRVKCELPLLRGLSTVCDCALLAVGMPVGVSSDVAVESHDKDPRRFLVLGRRRGDPRTGACYSIDLNVLYVRACAANAASSSCKSPNIQALQCIR